MDTNINIEDIYYKKYIKYKTKYLELKEQSGGVWKNCNDKHKINNIGGIINTKNNLFFAYNKTSQLNSEHYIIFERTYNELINILKPLIISNSSLLTGNSTKRKIYTEIKDKLDESYKLYSSFKTSYEYNKEELDTEIKLNNILKIFTNKSSNLKNEIKNIKLIIDENIKKIDNNNDLIKKINHYFEHIYTSFLCLKPSIKVTNSVTSAKQQNNIEMRQNMTTHINNYTPTTITQQTVLRHSQTVPVTPYPHTGSAPYSNNTKTDSVTYDSRKKMITSLNTVPHPRSSITQQLVHQTVPATAHQTAPIPTINHSQVRNNIVLLPLNPEPPFRKTQTPPEPPPRTAPQPPPRTAPKPPPRTAPT